MNQLDFEMQKLKDLEKKVLSKRENLNDLLEIFEIYEKNKNLEALESLFKIFSKYIPDFNQR